MSTTSGTLITFEGGEGAGKTTQVSRLAARLRASGRAVTVTREPGATRLGERIRDLLLDPANDDLAPRAEALLYAADRAQHVHRTVRPALLRGEVVLCDRFVDSSVVYQGGARGLGEERIRALSDWAAADLQPDLVLILDLDPRRGLLRASAHEFGGADRIESESLAFHDAVRAGFLAIASQGSTRYRVITADSPTDIVEREVWGAVEPLLAASDT